MSTYYGTPDDSFPEVYAAPREGHPDRVTLHWTVDGRLAASVTGDVTALRRLVADADRLLTVFDATAGPCPGCGTSAAGCAPRSGATTAGTEPCCARCSHPAGELAVVEP